MPYLYMLSFIFGIVILIWYLSEYKWDIKLVNSCLLLFAAGLFVRIIAALITEGFPNDIQAFKYWSDMLYEKGFKDFYTSDIFTDYPPGYMYVLYLLGFVKNFLGIEAGRTHTLLIKLPPIILDCVLSLFVYKTAKEKFTRSQAWTAGLLSVLNPASIILSAVWGQVDGVYVLLLVLSVYYLSKRNCIPAYGLYASALITKPQALMFIPLYFYSAADYFISAWDDKEKLKAVRKDITDGLFVAAFVLIISVIPFTRNFDISPVIKQYADTLGSYPHAVINAANIYALLGMNWADVTGTAGLPYLILSLVSVITAAGLCVYILWRGKGVSSYYFAAGILNMTVFMFTVKMHERYIYPSLVFFLLSYLTLRDKRRLLFYLGFSLTMLVNSAMALDTYIYGREVALMTEPLMVLAGFNILLTVMAYGGVLDLNKEKGIEMGRDLAEIKESNSAENINCGPEKPEDFEPLTSFDWKAMAVLTVLTGMISFFALGNNYAPQTLWQAESDSSAVTIELEESVYINKMLYYVGLEPNKKFTVSLSDDGEVWDEFPEITTKGVFSWKEEELGWKAKYIRIEAGSSDLSLFEIGFTDTYNEIIKISNSDAVNLIDEQSVVPVTPTYMNSTYFDEIYHARTAYEIIHGIKVYENTHPPLGKAIISLGIRAFGMTPFGWRFTGTLFGVLMVPAMYIFARRMFKDSKWAIFTSALLMFDFMRFAQTRISTIDTYVTFFIMLMYYFMYKYYCMSFYYTEFRKTLKPLLLSGLFMGIGIACKWPGVYAGAGLAVIFFYTMFNRFKEYTYADAFADSESIKAKFPKYFKATIGFCTLFFAGIPIIVYGLSYLTYFGTPGYSGINDIINNQLSMFNYHSKLESTHPYGSPWWKWPLLIRPVFYYSATTFSGLKAGISAFGNPAVWWVGIAAIVFTLKHVISKKDKTAVFLLIGFLAQYLPWTIVSRVTYMYHYFPSLIFVVLMISYMMKNYAAFKSKLACKVYLGIVILLFILFFPVISGIPVPEWYVVNFLRWLPSWQLIL